MTSPLRTT
jgi:hypothetical protein